NLADTIEHEVVQPLDVTRTKLNKPGIGLEMVTLHLGYVLQERCPSRPALTRAQRKALPKPAGKARFVAGKGIGIRLVTADQPADDDVEYLWDSKHPGQAAPEGDVTQGRKTLINSFELVSVKGMCRCRAPVDDGVPIGKVVGHACPFLL